MNANFYWKGFFLIALLVCASSLAHAQTVLLDDFNRPDNNTVGSGWTEVETTSPTSIQVLDNSLLITGAGGNGYDFFYQDVSANYSTNGLTDNTNVLTWAFNFRQSVNNPSGFNNNQIGLAFVLAGSNADFLEGEGYAVVLGSPASSQTDPIRLVRYVNGLDASANLTTFISGGDFGSQHLSVRVTYDPATDEWSLFAEGAVGAFPQADPRNTATQIGLTTADATITGDNLPYLGGLYKHQNPAHTAIFDDIYLTEIPTGPSLGFDLGSSVVIEGNSISIPVTFFNYTADVTVSVTAVGVTSEVTDFTFSPSSLTFSANGTQNITLNAAADVDCDDEELILTLAITSGGATLLTAVHTVEILDIASAYYSQASGNWSGNIWNSQPDGSGCPLADPNLPGISIIIQNGHTVTLDDTKSMLDLTIEAGGALRRPPGSGVRYCEVFGDFVLAEGTMGDPMANDALSIDFYGPAPNINGSGTVQVRQIRKMGNNNTHLFVNNDLVATANTAFLHNSFNCAFDVTIAAGTTTNCANLSIDGAGAAGDDRWGTFTINGQLNASGNLLLRTNNAIAGSQDIHYLVAGTGKLTVGGQVQGNGTIGGNAIARLTVQNGGELHLTAAGNPFTLLVPMRNVIDLQAGSLTCYQGTGDQIIEPSITYADVRIKGGSFKDLAGDTEMTGTLTLDDGIVRLGSYNLTIGGASGGNSNTYVQTNGTGALVQTVGSPAKFFPVGNAAYCPASLENTGVLDVFRIRVTDEVLADGTSGAQLTSSVVDHTWFVEEGTPGGSNATLTVQWDTPSQLTGFNPNLCYISHYDGTGWVGDTPGPANGFPPSTYDRKRSGLTSFSPFAVGSGSALPVTWLSFRAALEGDDVHLTWSTASESNNEGFDVQRSENGRDWQTIGFVQGAGTTSEVQNYSYTDPTPSTLNSQLAYYRLQQRDFDGTTDYSPIRVIELGTAGGIRVFPNPADEAVTVAFAEPLEVRGTIQLFNQNSRLAAEETLAPGTSAHTIRVAYLPAGTYVLRVVAGPQVWTKRLVVE